MGKEKKVFSTWVEAEIMQAINDRCASLGISKSDYMRSLILGDLGESSGIRGNTIHLVPLKNRARQKDSPDDYFKIDEKAEREWRRRKHYDNVPYERPTAIF